jgi:arsenite methyltransferase
MTAVSLGLDTSPLAEHYEQASFDRQFNHGKRLIERLAIRAGERVLDVGSGTGLLAAYVAELVGAEGSVVAVDPLALRIEIAQRKARPNLRFAVDDAYDLSAFAEGSFDVIYLNAVFHWFDDKRAPLRNFLRLLAPGGRLGISTGSREAKNTLHEIRREVLSRPTFREHGQPDRGLPNRVSPSELTDLLRDAGFLLDSLTVEPHASYQPDAEAAIQHANASSFGNFLGHLPAALRDEARGELIAATEATRTAQGIPLTGERLIAIARKP